MKNSQHDYSNIEKLSEMMNLFKKRYSFAFYELSAIEFGQIVIHSVLFRSIDEYPERWTYVFNYY